MNKTNIKEYLPFTGLFVLAAFLGFIADPAEGIASPKPFVPAVFIEAKPAEEGTGISLIRSDEWADQYPDEYRTYLMNNDNSEITDYIEENPYIRTLYEGYGFAISYGSARGHTFVIEDVISTGRPHKLANCFTCKTSDFTVKVLNDGTSAYAMDFADMEVQVTDAFGCFHCHSNEPGVLYVTHPYVTAAIGEDFTKVNAANLTCAQCHTEYYFDPNTKETKVSYQGLGQMSPADILAYENSLIDAEGNMFCDWVDADTGVRKLKVQHPEFETFMGAGSVHMSQMTCADCHMGQTRAEDGTFFTNHNWTSPLDNPELLRNTCSQCHQDLAEQVHTIQTATRERENEIGYALEQLDRDMAAAIEAGTLNGEALENARMAARNAQYYWDFVFVENSEGAHNSRLTNDCLDQAQAYLDEANACLQEQ